MTEEFDPGVVTTNNNKINVMVITDIMKQYETFELTFTGPVAEHGYADTDLTAVFEHKGVEQTVRGFYDGGGTYRVRFLPEEAGLYTWKVNGVVTGEGSEICEEADATHHGRVRAEGTNFAYEDGTPFYPFGTTVYALASQDDVLVEETLTSLAGSPFNKVRMCVFPKHYEYNHNDPPLYPFEKTEDGWDVSTPCIPFWQRFEKILERIEAMGIEIDLILFHPYDRWGFNALSREDNLLYLDYLIRRLSAYPGIWWSLANEYDLTMDHKSLSDWEEIEGYVAGQDPYHHLLSNHNCLKTWDYSRSNITHVSIQTKALTAVPDLLERYHKPVIVDECCYEGDIPQLWGSISAREMAYRFWRVVTGGGYCTHGETYLSDDDVLWWSRGGRLKGRSPERIAFLKKIVYELPGALTPVPGWFTQIEREYGDADPGDTPGVEVLFAKSLKRMEPADRALFLAGEHEYVASCGTDAYLWFYGVQCYSKRTLRLPEDRNYRIELIDVWEMTREVIASDASGETVITLPGHEGMAVLALST